MLATIRTPLALIAVAAGLLAGCGGGGTSSTVTTGPAAAATVGTSTATTTAGASSSTTSKATTAPAQSSTSANTSTTAPANEIKHYGKPAGEAEQEAVSKVVKAYYAALSTRNFHDACALLSKSVKSLVLSSLEQNPILHGKGCVGVFTLLLGHNGKSLSPEVTVHSVRLYRNEKGFALISTKDRRSGQIRVESEHGAWKVASLIGGPLR